MSAADWASGAVGVFLVLGVANLVAALALTHLRVPYCPECDHCRREDQDRKARRQEEQRRWNDEVWGNRKR